MEHGFFTVIVFIILAIQVIIVTFSGSGFGLYPNGLTIQQWAISVPVRLFRLLSDRLRYWWVWLWNSSHTEMKKETMPRWTTQLWMTTSIKSSCKTIDLNINRSLILLNLTQQLVFWCTRIQLKTNVPLYGKEGHYPIRIKFCILELR